MTPRPLDPEVVALRLEHMRDLVADLVDKGTLDVEHLQKHPFDRYGTEWILTQLVSLGVDVSSHIASATIVVHRESWSRRSTSSLR